MKTVLKWIMRALLALVLAALVIGLWNRDEITRLMAVNTLFDEDRIVGNFSNMDAAFLTRRVPRGDGPVSDLPQGAPLTLPDGAQAWIEDRWVTSLIVLHKGRIVFEDYYRGTGAQDRRISWSIAKSYLSALFGIAVEDGTIASLDDPVTRYVPALAGGAYDGATIRNVLQMSSGVTFDEDYLDAGSDINKMGRTIALGGSMDAFAASLTERFQEPGAGWQYVSIDTHVLAMVLRNATGRSLPELLGAQIIAPLGQEAAAYYLTDGDGVAFALGGLNLRSRDYARFGVMIEQNGAWQGAQIVPAEWIAQSTVPSARTAPGAFGYGYQWWMPADARQGEFMGRGIYGQYLYIDQSRDVVIVTTAADRKFREPGVSTQNIEMFRAFVAQVEEMADGTR